MPEEPPNVGPDTEFADPERQQLLQLLEAQLREHSPDFVLPLDVWAAVWLADITKLRRLTEMPPHERLLVLGRSVRTEVLKLCKLTPSSFRNARPASLTNLFHRESKDTRLVRDILSYVLFRALGSSFP
jgi:hypothetical protein